MGRSKDKGDKPHAWEDSDYPFGKRHASVKLSKDSSGHGQHVVLFRPFRRCVVSGAPSRSVMAQRGSSSPSTQRTASLLLRAYKKKKGVHHHTEAASTRTSRAATRTAAARAPRGDRHRRPAGTPHGHGGPAKEPRAFFLELRDADGAAPIATMTTPPVPHARPERRARRLHVRTGPRESRRRRIRLHSGGENARACGRRGDRGDARLPATDRARARRRRRRHHERPPRLGR